MLYREIIAVCSQIHTKHINTLCGQNVELLNVKLAVFKRFGAQEQCHHPAWHCVNCGGLLRDTSAQVQAFTDRFDCFWPLQWGSNLSLFPSLLFPLIQLILHWNQEQTAELSVALAANDIPEAGSIRCGVCGTVRPVSSRCVCVTHSNNDVYSTLCYGSGDLNFNAWYWTSNRLECC